MRVELKLKEGGVADYRFEARQIMTLPKEQWEQAVQRRLLGEPLQYILGEWEFYGLPFLVGEGVLIPRPDTETLIDAVLPLINKDSAVLDLCSGSGAVAICSPDSSADKCLTVSSIAALVDEYAKCPIVPTSLHTKEIATMNQGFH